MQVALVVLVALPCTPRGCGYGRGAVVARGGGLAAAVRCRCVATPATPAALPLTPTDTTISTSVKAESETPEARRLEASTLRTIPRLQGRLQQGRFDDLRGGRCDYLSWLQAYDFL